MEHADAERAATRVVEIAGRNWLTSQLLIRKIQVATPEVDLGIDLIAFKEVGSGGIKALPLQLKCARKEVFSLDKKYDGRGIMMIYVWNVETPSPEFYALSFDEALDVLGPNAQITKSWTDHGKYSINNKVAQRVREALKKYRNRWDRIEARLQAEPVSA